jgi:hypothetical protein
MNKKRQIEILMVAAQLMQLQEKMDTLRAEEEEYKENMPENLQGSERYEKADAACDAMQDVVD